MCEQKLKKIIFFTASTTGGGAEKMLFNIINSLDSNLFKSYLIITSDAKVPENTELKAEAYNYNCSKSRNAFFKICNTISKIKPSYVFTTSSTLGYMLALSKKILKHKFKVIIRCAVPPSEIIKTSIKDDLLRYIIKITYKYCDLIIAQTQYMKNDLIKSYSITPNKILVIRNIIDKAYLEKQSKEFVPTEFKNNTFNIVASGALYSVKGFDLLIDAISPIIIKNKNIFLWILGDERYENGYKNFLLKKIANYQLDNNIKLIGHKSNPYPYYKYADLFILSSRKEGFPNVVLESLFLKTPVVATNCVDFSNVIENGTNGFIVEKSNIEELQKAIMKAIYYNFDMNKITLSNYNYNKLFQQ